MQLVKVVDLAKALKLIENLWTELHTCSLSLSRSYCHGIDSRGLSRPSLKPERGCSNQPADGRRQSDEKRLNL